MKTFTATISPARWTRILTLATVAALSSFPSLAKSPTTPTPDPATELRFQDFFKLPVGAKGLEISSTLRQAVGKTVAVTGCMVQQEVPSNGVFLLTPRPVQMSEHANDDADNCRRPRYWSSSRPSSMTGLCPMCTS